MYWGKKAITVYTSSVIIILAISTLTTSFSQVNSSMINGVLAHSLTDAQANTLSSNGINWIRSDVSLDQNSNWYSIYQLAKRYSLSLIGTLLPYTMNFDNSISWKQVVQEAVNAYGSGVSVWEIWNEPTTVNSSCGLFQGTAQQYVDLMRIANEIIKSRFPNAIILGLGGLPLYSSGDLYLEQSLLFAQDVCDLGGMNYCDAISLHAYPYGDNPKFQESYKITLDKYRQITGKDVWITETGQESGGNSFNSSETIQANYLAESYQFLKSKNVKAYIWYEINDNNTGKNAVFQNTSTFGLYDINSNPKQALSKYFEVVNPLSTPTSNSSLTIEFITFVFMVSIIIVCSTIMIILKRKLNKNLIKH